MDDDVLVIYAVPVPHEFMEYDFYCEQHAPQGALAIDPAVEVQFEGTLPRRVCAACGMELTPDPDEVMDEEEVTHVA
jgi:hypothetical protein